MQRGIYQGEQHQRSSDRNRLQRIAAKMAKDPGVLKSVKDSTEEYRWGQESATNESNAQGGFAFQWPLAPLVCPTCGHCPTCGQHRPTLGLWPQPNIIMNTC